MANACRLGGKTLVVNWGPRVRYHPVEGTPPPKKLPSGAGPLAGLQKLVVKQLLTNYGYVKQAGQLLTKCQP